LEAVKDRRDGKAVKRCLDRLEKAAAKDDENLLPYFVECCNAYATVGEMVATLKGQWGEFKEPIRL
jgi:methylmalonyl-CoA mutase N-terminal domain/subunit